MNNPAPSNSSSVPQFATAEYASAPGSEICKSCNRAISGSYYRVNGALACSDCATTLQNQIPKDSHPLFVRGLLFGLGGALLGLILYSTFSIITGIEIGYLSLAVGYLVGKAIHMGSRGMAGRRYQIVAVALTYAAVSLSAVPIGLYEYGKEKKAASSASSQSGAEGNAKSSQDDPEEKAIAKDESAGPGIAKILGTLLLYGLASPFLGLENPAHGAIGIFILFIGVRIAWQLTAEKKLDILGPFQAKVPAAS
jgi:predicted lipid-binding transport protein (Tim44 family)